MKRIDFESELIMGLYYGDCYTIKEMTELLCCNSNVIYKNLKRYGIPLRFEKIIIEKELLESLYWGNEFSLDGIAKMFNCSVCVIEQNMRIYNISRRESGKQIEYEIEKELLEQLYLGNDYSAKEISDMFGCNEWSIFNRIHKFNIPFKEFEPWNKGMKNPYSETTLKRMSESKKGTIPWIVGKNHSIETRRKISKKVKEAYNNGFVPWNKGLKGYRSGEINNKWKGDNASYSAIHKYIQCHKPKPEGCEVCGKMNCRLELANLSHEYKRDIDDYKYMCVKCHRTFDDTLPQKYRYERYKNIEELNLCGLHRRLRTKHKHNGECQFCGLKTKRLDLSNISGAYLYHIEDYIYLCRKCHAKFDMLKGYNNLKDFII